MKTINLVIGIILLIIGVFYTAMPHSIHLSSGVGFGLSHGLHVLIGIVLIVIGIIILFVGRK